MIYAATWCPGSACDPCKPKPIIQKAYLTATFWIDGGQPSVGVLASDPNAHYYNGTVFYVTIDYYIAGKNVASVSGSSPPQYGSLVPAFYLPFPNVDINIDTTKPAAVTGIVTSSTAFDAVYLPRAVLY